MQTAGVSKTHGLFYHILSIHFRIFFDNWSHIRNPGSEEFAKEAIWSANFLGYHEGIFEAGPQFAVQTFILLTSTQLCKLLG